jgi:hypothetical protein
MAASGPLSLLKTVWVSASPEGIRVDEAAGHLERDAPISVHVVSRRRPGGHVHDAVGKDGKEVGKREDGKRGREGDGKEGRRRKDGKEVGTLAVVKKRPEEGK